MHITYALASDLLRSGKVVAVPTETVYGLAASLYSESGIAQIFHLKKRPLNNPLIVHTATVDEVKSFASSLPPHFDRLANTFWPGPLTLILSVDQKIPSQPRAGLSTAAFRIPKHPTMLKLLNQTGPLVAPSANLSGRPSATSPEHVEQDFGADFPVLDGGPCTQGVESTILIFSEEKWQIARLGALSAEELAKTLNYQPTLIQNQKQPICPGQFYRHYAPETRLHIDGQWQKAALIVGFSDRKYPVQALSWGSSTDPSEVAQNIYRIFRQLDKQGVKEVWLDMDFPDDGLWATIRERILRASCS